MLRKILFGLILLLSSSFSLQATENPENIQNILTMLETQIESCSTPQEKARLYCYQARNYLKLKQVENARSSYIKALNADYTGWLLNEYGYFLYKNGMYELAYLAAKKVLKDFPHLSREATVLQKRAFAKYEQEYYEKNPPEIVMEAARINPNRVTRHDLIRKYRQAHPAPTLIKAPKTQVRSS